jgi:hypothetical protein
MGRDSRLKRPEVIHRSKLFGGMQTAAEVHAKHGFRDPCAIKGCKNLPVIQIKMFMLHDEFVQRNPQMATMIAMSNPGGKYIPCTPTTFGPMVRFSTVAACRTHQKDAEMAAAKAPSYVLVEIDRGPGADKPIVQVASNIARS